MKFGLSNLQGTLIKGVHFIKHVSSLLGRVGGDLTQNQKWELQPGSIVSIVLKT